MTGKKVLVGLSGGVDSAVSAYLLKEQGFDVSAGFMINYLTEDDSCPTRTDMAIAKEVAEYLKIPFFTFDFVEEYEQKVLTYIFEGYKKGLTPNPDVFCNTWIKFDLFREEALSYGFDAVATGHYARIDTEGTMNNEQGIMHRKLLRGVDPDKDQSYFLAALSRKQLEQAMFPIGNLPKSEVRDIARKAGLPNAERKDSQGLCFVGKVDFAEFLKAHIPAKKGNIITTDGAIIGEHDGAFQYTIGQRKGICVGGGPALYVVEKNVENNTIIVGEENDPRLLRSSCIVSELNWLEDVSLPLNCEAQIRYRQAPQECSLKEHKAQSTKHKEGIVELSVSPTVKGDGSVSGTKGVGINENPLPYRHPPGQGDSRTGSENSELVTRNSSLFPGSTNPQPITYNPELINSVNLGNLENLSTLIEVSFDVPQRAITPGQVCVFYDGDTVLGSGIIMS